METPVLNFRIGDETRPKIEVLEEGNIQKTFFYEVYQKAFRLIQDILPPSPNFDPIDDDVKIKNNIIAFVGDRGSGKTSCMKTIHKMLLNKNDAPYKSACETLLPNASDFLNPFKFASLPIIDPSYFEDKTNLVEIVVAHMFSQFKAHITKANWEQNTSIQDIQNDKTELIKCFQNAKACLDIIHGETEKPNDFIDSLDTLAGGINFKTELNKLITSYLKFFKYTTLVIAIDDIDLHTRHAYQMVEQMRKYLIQPNVIILAGVKISQLNDLIKQYYYQAHKDLIDQDGLSDTIEDMSGRYLSKLFPLNQRIMMPDLNQRWGCAIRIEKNGQNPSTFDSIIQACILLIFQRTKYVFYYTLENPPLIIPRNLRDLLNFISFLYQMTKLHPEKNTEKNTLDFSAQLLQNRCLFKNYFISTWCREHLSNQMFTFIKDLETTNITDINKSVIDFLTQLTENEGINLDRAITYKSNRGYNVSLSDAMYVLNKSRNNQTIPYINYFTAAIKTFYSFLLSDSIDGELTDKFYDKFQDSVSSKSTQNNDQIPILLKKLNKLNKIPDYEKLLGGNIIRVASTNMKDFTQRPFIHMHLINNVSDIYNRWNLYFLIKYPLPLFPDDIFRFRMFEFIVLTSYLNTDNLYNFRSKRHYTYYTSIEDAIIDPSNAIVYSSTAMLFSVIRIYNLYRIFRSDRPRTEEPQQIDTPQAVEAQQADTPQAVEAQPADTSQAVVAQQIDTPQAVEAQQVDTPQAVEAQQADTSQAVEAQQVDRSQAVEAQQVDTPQAVEAQQADTSQAGKTLSNPELVTWRDFFLYIDEIKKQSLIYQILHYEGSDAMDEANEPQKSRESEKPDGTDLTQFRNSYIENMFIRNMDTYDALMDYLPNLKKQYKDEQQNEYWKTIMTFYKKLAEFQYYEYSNTEEGAKTSKECHTISFQVLTPVAKFLETMDSKKRSTFSSIFQPDYNKINQQN